jgi:hypothetical protein
VSWFDQSTAVVDFGPTSAPHRYGARRWFLWPVLAWRVAVPAVRWRGLNIFQHYVLALLDTGIRVPREIAQRLDLDSELVGKVLHELEGMGYTDPGTKPTERGRSYLHGKQSQDPDVIPGYVFRDAIGGGLHPRFVPDTLNYIPVASADGIRGGAKVDRSSAGRRDVPYCTAVWPEEDPNTDPPTADQIRAVCRTWLRHAQAFERYAVSPTDWSGEAKEKLRGLGDGRVSILSQASEPIFITSFVYFPEDLESGTSWQVCDPFGLGVSAQLRGQIEELVDAEDRALRRLLKGLDEVALRVDGRELAELRGKRRMEARARVAGHLGAVDLPLGVKRALELMEMSRVGCEEADATSNRRERQRHLAALVRRAYTAAEELFSWLTQVWAGADVVARLGMTAEHNASLLAEIALNLGYRNDETLDSLPRLLLVRRGQVKGVLVDGNVDLPAMAACALLSTADHSAHPLRLAATAVPDLFVLLDRIKRERDPVAHHGAAGVPDGVEEWACAAAYAMCGAMLPAAMDDPEPAPGDGDSEDPSTWAVRLAQRLQTRAVRRVDKEFGLGIRQMPGVRTELIELIRRAEEIELLAAEEADTDSASIELLIAGGKLLEAMMSSIVTASPRPGWVGSASEEEARATARSLAKQAGFELDDSANSLVCAKLRLVRRAATTGRGTLSALAMVALLACRDNDVHPLRAIARMRPDFLITLASLDQVRGHGDRPIDPEASAAFAAAAMSLMKITFQQIA